MDPSQQTPKTLAFKPLTLGSVVIESQPLTINFDQSWN